MSHPELRACTPEELAHISEPGDVIVDAIQQFKPQQGMCVISYVLARLFLDLNPVDGVTKLEVFDRYIAGVRFTLERNIELDKQACAAEREDVVSFT